MPVSFLRDAGIATTWHNRKDSRGNFPFFDNFLSVPRCFLFHFRQFPVQWKLRNSRTSATLCVQNYQKERIKVPFLRNIKYFCDVKEYRKKYTFRLFLAIVLLLCGANSTFGQESAEAMDSVEISLLTCSPHDAIYSLYGHSAVRYHDLRTGEDLVFNYGVFNYRVRFFVLKFMLGKTDYELGVCPFSRFSAEYEHFGSQVQEQVINLSAEEKLRLKYLLAENYLPQNRVYRYNIFYDNCSIRARNIILKSIQGKVEFHERDDYNPSFRDILHAYTADHPWVMFGDDICLGINADKKIGRELQEFLPDNLMYGFSTATIYEAGFRPFVKETRTVVKPGVQIIERGFPFTPKECAIGLLLLTAILASFEVRYRKLFYVADAVWLLLFGICGMLLTVLAFSEHPATTLNLQLLVFNPLFLFVLVRTARRMRQHRKDNFWKWLILLVALFLVGRTVQHYAEGMMVLACCLLFRSVTHLYLEKKLDYRE